MHHTIGRRDDFLISRTPIGIRHFFGAPINEARKHAGPSVALVHLPAVSEGSDFEIVTAKKLHFPPTNLINVRLNMRYPNNGETLSRPQHKQHLSNSHQARYTAGNVLRTRPKTYRTIVHLLADPNWSVAQMSKNCRVSEHTVRAIRARESQDIAERKKKLAVMLANVAELGAEHMEQTIGKASLRDAVMTTGGSNPFLTVSWVNRHQDAKSKNNR